MTNTKAHLLGLDTIDVVLDKGFIPSNGAAVLKCYGAMYRHDTRPITVFSDDVESATFVITVYQIVRFGNKSHFGPELYSIRTNNLPLAVFEQQLAAMLKGLPVM